MPSSAEQPAERRRAVDTLRIASAITNYAAIKIANGVGPEEAQRAALEAAADLEAAAASLRRLARPDPAAGASARRDDRGASARRAAALELAAAGWSARRSPSGSA